MIKLDPNFTLAQISAAVLKEPEVQRGKVHKGVLILNFVDEVLSLLPELRTFYFILERKGWHGFNTSHLADIKLIEDSTTLDLTRRYVPDKILLELGDADFVDEDVFRPLNQPPEFDVIQIACWSPRKRIELLIETAARLPELSFVHLAHFENCGSADELKYRDACLAKAAQLGAKITFPFGHCDRNEDLPTTKPQMNEWLNRARLGVLTATKEGHNRFKMECLAADRPMLVASDAGVPTQKHLNAQTGVLFEPNPAALAAAITTTLRERERFKPRDYVLSHTGRVQSLLKLKAALRALCEKTGEPYRFDDIDWDGRNEHITWGKEAFVQLKDSVSRHQNIFAE